ncbi:hypothetical protein SESBI_23855 [Sesbania bispinosa]|nr:hypothetical protein SESBI_23855 [Sesbania bispinosa]
MADNNVIAELRCIKLERQRRNLNTPPTNPTPPQLIKEPTATQSGNPTIKIQTKQADVTEKKQVVGASRVGTGAATTEKNKRKEPDSSKKSSEKEEERKIA